MIKKGKTYGQKVIFYTKNTRTFQIWKKIACQNMVAMETASSVNNNMSYQIVRRQISGKLKKFGGFYFNIEKVINGQSRDGQIPPPTPV